MSKRGTTSTVALALSSLVITLFAVAAVADEVTDWNRITMQTVKTGGSNALIAGRVLAMVHASIFDAVNGIERRYDPLHVDFDAPPGASRRAAAIQAAYAVLVKQYPSQKSALDVKRDESLAGVATQSAVENSDSIARGIEWGQTVADDVMAWRATDGFAPPPPPFTGGTAPGQWRPTPPAFAPGTLPQFATMTPWAIPSPSSFRPPAPPALSTAAYAADVNEVKEIGRNTSTTRTQEQSDIAAFWFGNTVFYWEPLARQLAEEHHTTLSENARFFALMNIAMADAGIACWNAKYLYVYWRPITAIQLADTDGNAATEVDPGWKPLFNTPTHPEYLSGHSTVSGAAAMALQIFFGDSGTFTIDSDFVPGAVRTFTSFDQASTEVGDSRVYAGIHFRTACQVGKATGQAIAQYVMNNSLKPIHGNKFGQTSHTHGSSIPVGDGENGGE